jgi:hypothetical protein
MRGEKREGRKEENNLRQCTQHSEAATQVNPDSRQIIGIVDVYNREEMATASQSAPQSVSQPTQQFGNHDWKWLDGLTLSRMRFTKIFDF